ncbi:RNA polymerase sigma factor [Dictyobacter kobayashii]|nr:RNA polymerase sigma factor [Dictyobacter kobayashii]
MNKQSNGADFNFQQFLQENMESIEGIIRSYVIRMGLTHGESVQNMTLDILNEATVEALAHIEAFKTVQQPRAWFLGIAANMIKRKRVTLARNQQHEYPVGTLTSSNEAESESDFFDQISQLTHAGPEQEIEAREQVAEMLALASPADRKILRLAFIQDLDTHNLALALNVSEGAARVRLHRTINRLRLTWQQHEQRERSR